MRKTKSSSRFPGEDRFENGVQNIEHTLFRAVGSFGVKVLDLGPRVRGQGTMDG